MTRSAREVRMGRPTELGKGSELINVRLQRALWLRLKEAAEKAEVPMSELVRSGIERELKAWE